MKITGIILIILGILAFIGGADQPQTLPVIIVKIGMIVGGIYLVSKKTKSASKKQA